MDNIVDSLENAYQEFVVAATDVLEAKETYGDQKTPAADAALEAFKHKWDLFRVACDQAEDFVESMKQRIGSELLVDKASSPMTRTSGQLGPTGLPPINGVGLQHMFKSARRLLTELQHGSGSIAADSCETPAGSTHSHPSTPLDSRFSEDST